MWPDAKLAERLAKDYVPTLIDVDKDETTGPIYSVSAMPTLVIAEADGTMLVKQVGAPFSTPAEAIEWLDKVGTALTDMKKLEEAYTADKSAANADKLTECYTTLGATDKVVKLYQAQLDALAKDSKDRGPMLVKLARAQLAGEDMKAARATADEAAKLIAADTDAGIDLDVLRAELVGWDGDFAIVDKIYKARKEALLAKKDERLIAIAFAWSNSRAVGASNDGKMVEGAKEIRAEMLAMVAGFPASERIWEIKVYAAYYAYESGDIATAKKEMKEVADKGKGEWADTAKLMMEMWEE